MTNLLRNAVIKFRKHDSNTQFETAPSASPAAYFLEPLNSLLPVDGVTKLEKDIIRGDNHYSTFEVGPQEATLALELLVRGINGNDGGSAATYATKTEIGQILDVICGVDGNDDGVAGGSDVVTNATPDITVDPGEGSDYTIGNAVLFNTGTEWVAREITGIATDTLTMDRGWSGTATSANIVPSASWYLDAADPSHTHAYFLVESDGTTSATEWGRALFGCMSSATLNVPNGGLVTLSTDWQTTKFTSPAHSSLTFSAPTVGDEIVAIDSPFFIGSTQTDLIELSVDFGLELQKHQTYDGTNGFSGYKVIRKRPVITGKIYYNQTTMATLQGATAQDLAVQLGRSGAGAMYVRMPAASIESATRSDFNGQEAIDFVAVGTRPSAGNGALRIHLF